jgi:hypothetical protein
MDERLRAAASTMISLVFAMVSTLIAYSPRLEMIIDSDPIFGFTLTDLGKLAHSNPTLTSWEESMDYYWQIMERRPPAGNDSGAM